MRKSIINKYILSGLFVTIGLSLGLTSCRDDITYGEPDISDDAIRVSAGINGDIETRADGAEPIKSGTFTIAYPYYYSDIPSIYGGYRYLYQFGVVTFGYTGQETTGFVNVANPTNTTAPKDLVWSRLNNSTNDGIFVKTNGGVQERPTLFLDNIPKKDNSSAADTTVTFTANDYKDLPFYKAGRLMEDGSNDLIWGTAVPEIKSQFIHFDMSHRLSKFHLNVVVEEGENSLGLSLEHASVMITDLLLEAEKFSRGNGSLSFAANITPKNLYLVGWEGGVKPTESDPTQSPGTTWKGEGEVAGNTTTYSTYDFVIPPQNLNTGLNRQKLIVRIPKEEYNSGTDENILDKDSVTFWAYLPSSMYVLDENGNQSNTSLGLNFMPGYDLTLTTKMKPGEPELEFMPVLVEQWVNVGEFPPKADENGIRTFEEFQTMLTYWEPKYNPFQLTRYGYQASNDVWHFQLQKEGITFVQTDITGKMIRTQGQPNFVIEFRNRPMVMILPDGRKYDLARGTDGQSILYVVLTTEPDSGVSTADMFTKGYSQTTTNQTVTVPGLIQAYGSTGYAWSLDFYGNYDSDASKWTFKISEDITLNYYDIVSRMQPAAENPIDFEFSFDPGVTVTLTNAPSGISSTPTETELYDIVTKREAGLFSSDEFKQLIVDYASDNTAGLSLYGTLQGSNWIFPVYDNLTLNEAEIQGGMQGSDYSFNLQNGYKITLEQYDGSTYANITSDNLVEILNLNKMTGIGSSTSFSNLVNAYQSDFSTRAAANEVSKYGYCILPDKSWIFVFTSDFTISQDEIAGKMVPVSGIPGSGYSFSLGSNIITVTDEEGHETQYEGESGEQTLYILASTPVITPESPSGPTDPDNTNP